MSPAEIADLMAAARQLRIRAGIGYATVCAALGLHQSELSMWENRRRAPKGPRGTRYVRFVAGLRRALDNQAEAVLQGCDTAVYVPEAWHVDERGRVRFGAPEGTRPVGAGRGRG